MSNKPEDVTDEAWEKASETVREFSFLFEDGFHLGDDEPAVEAIARAMMAAVEAEREACAAALEDPNVDVRDRSHAASTIRSRTPS